MSDYTWILTQHNLLGDSSDAVGQIGPRGSKKRLRFDTVISRGVQFPLRTTEGALRYAGYIPGEFSGFEPLDDYGRRNGCTDIEYERDDCWVAPQERCRSFAPLSRSAGSHGTKHEVTPADPTDHSPIGQCDIRTRPPLRSQYVNR